MKKEKVTIPCLLKRSILCLNHFNILKNDKIAYDPAINQSIVSGQQAMDVHSAFPLPGAASCSFLNIIKRIHRISIPALVIHRDNDNIDPPKTSELFLNLWLVKNHSNFFPREDIAVIEIRKKIK
jgi:pimeloyl-ACP methyl ester carboxylesterase